MSNPTAYDLVVLENERLAKQLEAAQADARYLDAKVDFSAKECITKDNTIKCLMMERDEARKEAECFKMLDGQANRLIERLKFELEEARAERSDLAFKLDKLQSDNLNASKYREDQVNTLVASYKTLIGAVCGALIDAPSIYSILKNNDSSDGDRPNEQA